MHTYKCACILLVLVFIWNYESQRWHVQESFFVFSFHNPYENPILSLSTCASTITCTHTWIVSFSASDENWDEPASLNMRLKHSSLSLFIWASTPNHCVVPLLETTSILNVECWLKTDRHTLYDFVIYDWSFKIFLSI
jgi:hypothetical protein